MVRITLAANQGAMGGGEVMLLRCAEAVRDLGLGVEVVAPATPGETAQAARDAGLDTTALAGADRPAYSRALRRWDRSRAGVLWCHGLVPALATAGHPRRIVHLHQLPQGRQQQVALRVARLRALAVLVPSAFMQRSLPGTRALPNWTDPVSARQRSRAAGPPVLGFLGRVSQDKGADLLAEAVLRLDQVDGSALSLLVAGDERFVPASQQAAVDAALARLGPRVDRPGWIAREEFFEAVDVAVFPSVWPEPFGLGVAEAMSAGVPVVVSDAGALPELVGDTHPWVARAGDVPSLVAAISAALAGDPAPVEAARRRWEAEFSPTAGRRRLAALLDDLGLLPVEAAS